DVMRDSRHAFENGLPPDGNRALASANEWGYVTNQQFLTNAFSNEGSSRQHQDVGLDGLPNTGAISEATHFEQFISQLNSGAREVVLNDPSADDFTHYFDPSFESRNAKILERYKNYNGLDGNSPITTTSADIARSATQTPDNEDLNADNTLNELEEYYEYDVELRPGLDIGHEYIVDKVEAKGYQGQGVYWYLFRIPVRDFENKIGNISGFKSIRYMRMLLTGFEQPVVLRMSNFRMIGSRWRRYQSSLRGGGFMGDEEPNY